MTADLQEVVIIVILLTKAVRVIMFIHCIYTQHAATFRGGQTPVSGDNFPPSSYITVLHSLCRSPDIVLHCFYGVVIAAQCSATF